MVNNISVGNEVIISNTFTSRLGINTRDIPMRGFVVSSTDSYYLIKVTNYKSQAFRPLNDMVNHHRIIDTNPSYLYCRGQFVTDTHKRSRYWNAWNRKTLCYKVDNIHKCSICGRLVDNPSDYTLTDNNKIICYHCSVIHSYSTRNNNSIRKPTNKGTKYGFELEAVCKTSNATLDKQVANIVSLGYDIIPTYDSSLPANGVEFKTPIMNSLRGATALLSKMSEYVDFDNKRCGQHINISNPKFTDTVRRYIIAHPAPLDILRDEMYNRVDDTRLVCGRHFDDTRYAQYNGSYDSHFNWINLSNSGRAEFRLSKLRTPQQYVNLAKMWAEIMDVLVDYRRELSFTDKVNNKYGNKLIRIFNKYVEINKKL